MLAVNENRAARVTDVNPAQKLVGMENVNKYSGVYLYVSRLLSPWSPTASTSCSSPSGLHWVIVVLGANPIFVMIFLSVSLLFPSLAYAYTFKFTSVPTQCQELSLAIEGQGSPPYRVLIIPVGPSTAPNNVEVRRVIDQTFPNDGTTVSFPLRFPANSQFVAVVRLFAPISFSFHPYPHPATQVSDNSGFGTGGTSVSVTVQSSSNSSCYDTSQSVQPQFVFSLYPDKSLTQCSSTRLWWDNATVQGYAIQKLRSEAPHDHITLTSCLPRMF